jgi:hypothetical protein
MCGPRFSSSRAEAPPTCTQSIASNLATHLTSAKCTRTTLQAPALCVFFLLAGIFAPGSGQLALLYKSPPASRECRGVSPRTLKSRELSPNLFNDKVVPSKISFQGIPQYFSSQLRGTGNALSRSQLAHETLRDI